MFRSVRQAGYVERRFRARDVELNYAEGPANGEPLILLPGQSMPWESYTKVLPALARRFHVFALDVRGHGRSGWTPGAYTFGRMGDDVAQLLREVVGRPAIVSGNSSGGVIAVAAAVRAPELVRGIVPEDPPLFSCEYPRIRDCYVFGVLERAVKLAGPGPRDIAGFFSGFEVPTEGSQKIMRFPKPAVALVRLVLRVWRLFRPTGPVDLPFLPLNVRLFVRGLGEYDLDFARACLQGTIGGDFDHAEALARVRCPMLLLQADWFMHPQLGLVGAMNDEDLARVRSLVPHLEHRRIRGAHVLHMDRPADFVGALVSFADSLAEEGGRGDSAIREGGSRIRP